MPTRKYPLSWLGLGLAIVAVSAGCDAPWNALEGDDNLVHVFSTHHATPTEDGFPDRGDDDAPRFFETDTGWRITLAQAWVTTTSVTLMTCDGEYVPLEMYWGPLPEDLTLEDLETFSVAGSRVPGNEYCQLLVEYGPYPAADVRMADGEDDDQQHLEPDNPAVIDASIYLAGRANRNGVEVPFEFRSEDSLLVEIDLSELMGVDEPLVVEHGNFPRELTISKTYDRFFDGVNFDQMDEQAIRESLVNVVGRETRVALGSRPKP